MLPKDNEEKKKENDDIDEQQYALISAAMRGDQQETKELLANPDININGVDEKGNSALHWAAYFDEAEVMEILINAPNIDINLKSKRGNTCLHMAAVANAGNSLTLLLNLGTKNSEALFNEQNNWGESALHLAASTGKIKAIEILCKANVDTTLKDNWSRTALRVAYENLEQDAINTLSNYCSAEIVEDAKKVEQSRIKLGKDIEKQQQKDDKDKNVMKGNNNEMLKEFMNEMQIMQKKIKESLSLEKIKEKHAFDVGGKVVDKPVIDPVNDNDDERAGDVNKQKVYKYKLASKFEYGVSPKNLEQLEQWLGDDEINNDGKDMFGWTALHKVIFWQKNEFVVPLLENMSGEAINCIGPEGEAAIHMALSLVLNGGKKKILEWMVQSEKVDKSQKNKAGLTSKEIATKNNADKEILDLLE